MSWPVTKAAGSCERHDACLFGIASLFYLEHVARAFRLLSPSLLVNKCNYPDCENNGHGDFEGGKTWL